MVMKSVILRTIKIGNVKNDNHNDSNKINDNFYIVYFEGDINKDIDVQIKPFAYL